MELHRTLLRPVCLALMLSIGGWLPALADDRHDHDRARQALEAGEVLPLRTVLERVEREYPGQVMEVELERKGERWVYEIKMLRTGGALQKLKFDARNGTLLDSRSRNSANKESNGESNRTAVRPGEKP